MTPRWHRIMQKLQAATRVEAGPLPTPCWLWTGPDDGEQGYGRMSLDGHTVKVHRVGYMQFNGYLPPKKHVDHLCRNRRCWNPEHLEAVTHKQNQKRRRKAVLGACKEGGVTSEVKLALYVEECADLVKSFPALERWTREQLEAAGAQCACEKLGVTAGVRGKERCPGCPKRAQPAHEAPASCAAPASPTSGEAQPAEASSGLVVSGPTPSRPEAET